MRLAHERMTRTLPVQTQPQLTREERERRDRANGVGVAVAMPKRTMPVRPVLIAGREYASMKAAQRALGWTNRRVQRAVSEGKARFV